MHTYVMTWGEMMTTLEDMSMLLNLYDFGLIDITLVEVFEQDEKLITQLNECMEIVMDSHRQLTFSSWVKYFFGQVSRNVNGLKVLVTTINKYYYVDFSFFV